MWKHYLAITVFFLSTIGAYLFYVGWKNSESAYANFGSFSGGTFASLVATYSALYGIRAMRAKSGGSVPSEGGGSRDVPEDRSGLARLTCYAETVGRRMKWLREDVLNLSLREMAEFLGMEVISQLERYEDGADEYPLSLIKSAETFFRINRRFVESGVGPVFCHFHLSQESVNDFLAQGYRPIFACCPRERGDLLCYLVFEERKQGLTRIAMADRYGSFASNGGGQINIGYLINALLDVGGTPGSVRIVTVTEAEWAAIGDGSYYSREPFRRFGGADRDCIDIFKRWFDEYAESRERWAATSSSSRR